MLVKSSWFFKGHYKQGLFKKKSHEKKGIQRRIFDNLRRMDASLPMLISFKGYKLSMLLFSLLLLFSLRRRLREKYAKLGFAQNTLLVFVYFLCPMLLKSLQDFNKLSCAYCQRSLIFDFNKLLSFRLVWYFFCVKPKHRLRKKYAQLG